MQKIVSDPELGDIVLARRRGTRRVSLSVRHNGSIRLTMPYLSTWKEGLRFLESKREWIIATRERMQSKYGTPKPLDATTEKILRERAKQTFPAMTAQLAIKYGFNYGRISVRKSRTRWGSCSSKNDISLSIYLAALPEHLQRFVILHELCHTRIKNHSPQFHALLNSLVEGDEKQLTKELKGFKI